MRSWWPKTPAQVTSLPREPGRPSLRFELRPQVTFGPKRLTIRPSELASVQYAGQVDRGFLEVAGQFVRFARGVNDAALGYRVYGPNSNTYAHEVLRMLNLEITPAVWVPGWDGYLMYRPVGVPPI